MALVPFLVHENLSTQHGVRCNQVVRDLVAQFIVVDNNGCCVKIPFLIRLHLPKLAKYVKEVALTYLNVIVVKDLALK